MSENLFHNDFHVLMAVHILFCIYQSFSNGMGLALICQLLLRTQINDIGTQLKGVAMVGFDFFNFFPFMWPNALRKRIPLVDPAKNITTFCCSPVDHLFMNLFGLLG